MVIQRLIKIRITGTAAFVFPNPFTAKPIPAKEDAINSRPNKIETTPRKSILLPTMAIVDAIEETIRKEKSMNMLKKYKEREMTRVYRYQKLALSLKRPRNGTRSFVFG